MIKSTDRYTILGPSNGCESYCEGTGWVPVYMSEGDHQERDEMSIYMDDEDDPFLIKKWREAEVADPADDGWHFVKCPSCQDDMYTVQWEYGDGRVTLYRFTTARRAKVFAWLTIRLEKMLRKMGR